MVMRRSSNAAPPSSYPPFPKMTSSKPETTKTMTARRRRVAMTSFATLLSIVFLFGDDLSSPSSLRAFLPESLVGGWDAARRRATADGDDGGLRIGPVSLSLSSVPPVHPSLDVVGPNEDEFRNDQSRRRTDDAISTYRGLGTFYVTVYVGTPPQRRRLVVSTGSDQTAFPCTHCTNCGPEDDPTDLMSDPYFSPIQSATHSIPSCSNGECTTGESATCYEEEDKDACVNLFKFTGEGGEDLGGYKSYEAKDLVYVDTNPPPTVGADPEEDGSSIPDLLDEEYVQSHRFELLFQCQQVLHGHFASHTINGLLGLSSRSTSFVNQMYHEGFIPRPSFGLCFNEQSRRLGTAVPEGTTAGTLTFGGVSRAHHATPLVFARNAGADEENGDSYAVSIRKIHLRPSGVEGADDATGGRIATLEGVDYDRVNGIRVDGVGGTVVDPGIPHTHLNVAVRPEFEKAWTEMTGTSYAYGKIALTEEELEALPTILIQLEADDGSRNMHIDPDDIPGLVGSLDKSNPTDVLLAVPPRNYMEYSPSTGFYRNRFFLTYNTGPPGGSKLGSNVFQGKDVYFDLEKDRIGFAEHSKCVPGVQRFGEDGLTVRSADEDGLDGGGEEKSRFDAFLGWLGLGSKHDQEEPLGDGQPVEDELGGDGNVAETPGEGGAKEGTGSQLDPEPTEEATAEAEEGELSEGDTAEPTEEADEADATEATDEEAVEQATAEEEPEDEVQPEEEQLSTTDEVDSSGEPAVTENPELDEEDEDANAYGVQVIEGFQGVRPAGWGDQGDHGESFASAGTGIDTGSPRFIPMGMENPEGDGVGIDITEDAEAAPPRLEAVQNLNVEATSQKEAPVLPNGEPMSPASVAAASSSEAERSTAGSDEPTTGVSAVSQAKKPSSAEGSREEAPSERAADKRNEATGGDGGDWWLNLLAAAAFLGGFGVTVFATTGRVLSAPSAGNTEHPESASRIVGAGTGAPAPSLATSSRRSLGASAASSERSRRALASASGTSSQQSATEQASGAFSSQRSYGSHRSYGAPGATESASGVYSSQRSYESHRSYGAPGATESAPGMYSSQRSYGSHRSDGAPGATESASGVFSSQRSYDSHRSYGAPRGTESASGMYSSQRSYGSHRSYGAPGAPRSVFGGASTLSGGDLMQQADGMC